MGASVLNTFLDGGEGRGDTWGCREGALDTRECSEPRPGQGRGPAPPLLRLTVPGGCRGSGHGRRGKQARFSTTVVGRRGSLSEAPTPVRGGAWEVIEMVSYDKECVTIAFLQYLGNL